MNKRTAILTVTLLLFAAWGARGQRDDDGLPAVEESLAPSIEEEEDDDDDSLSEIDFPEAMTYDIDSLLGEYNAQTYITAGDTLCDRRGVNPAVSDSLYRDRLRRLPTVIEMPYNSIVRRFIERYTTAMRRNVSYMLAAANFYMPIFEQALDTYGAPLELKYLPVIESALNPKAVSRAGATGLWQFMLASGKQYGMTVNSLVDERRDPVKASYAAARYLTDLYKIFGDWTLSIAAYNCGPENVTKAIHRAGGVKDYWRIYPFLPRETRGYVPAFIAANYIMTYYCEHNICPMTATLPLGSDTVVVTRDVHFDQIAALCGVSKDQLRALNPQYRRDVVPGLAAPSAIRMPMAAVALFIDNEDSVYAYHAGELLTKRSDVAVSEKAPTYTKARRRQTRRQARRSVTVRRGQTLGSIAKANGTTVAKLKRLNALRGTTIQAGKKLRVR